jgi:hypothetical protein
MLGALNAGGAMRGAWFAMAATVVMTAAICLGTSRTSLAAGKCQSVEAKCAVEAGGKCDTQTGHWCYGVSREGEYCGGTQGFSSCLARARGSHAATLAASGSDTGKCTSIQARCILEAGGYCDRNTGHWRTGFVLQLNYGGNYQAFTACLDRAMAEGKLKQ